MREHKNLYYLADVISTQTRIDREIVLSFLNQFFKEVERELIVTSTVKIDKLGIFRVIKSVSGDRLLFLGKFASDSVSPRMTDPVPPPNNSDISVETNFADAELTGMWPENDRKRVETNTSDIHKNASVAPSSDEESVVAFYDTEKQVRRKKLWRKIKIFTTFALTIVVVVGIMYNLYRSNENNKEQVFSPFSLIFTELDNSDTTHFTHTIRIDGADADFYSLSKIYYFHEQFWPYIYNANEAVVSDPFEIPEGTIIRIPKLDAELIDYKNPSSINKAKNLVNEIMNSSTRQATTNNNDGMVVLE